MNNDILEISNLIKEYDAYTYGHCVRVAKFTRLLAEKYLEDISAEELDLFEAGALIHDIGKINIDSKIINKNGSLTEEEFKKVQSHVNIPEEIKEKYDLPQIVIDAAETHHMNYSNKSYSAKDRTDFDKVPIVGEIIACVDVFDALSSKRPYRNTIIPQEKVIATLYADCEINKLNKNIVDCFKNKVLNEINNMNIDWGRTDKEAIPILSKVAQLHNITKMTQNNMVYTKKACCY